MRHILPVLSLLFIPFFFGCQPSSPPAAADAEQSLVPPPSDVPLRIGVAGELTDPELLERQWLSESEQPISISSVSIDEFLKQDRAAIDVVLFPSYLLGELVQRGWVVPLPSVFDSSVSPSSVTPSSGGQSSGTGEMSGSSPGDLSGKLSGDQAASLYPNYWGAQAIYGTEDYAIPLGLTSPVMIASAPMWQRMQAEMPGMEVSWVAMEQMVEREESQAETESAQADVAEDLPIENINYSALVDRFLYLSANFSARNLKYGLLFETKSLKSELRGDEFRRAAELLVLLSEQRDGLELVLGSHSKVWKLASENESAVVAIAAPGLLARDVAAITAGQPVPMSETVAWNLGGGIMAAIAGDCRQTSQSNAFLRWLSTASTRNALEPLLPGVQGDGRNVAPDSLISRAADLLRETTSENLKSSEPRLPHAHEYRRILGEHLHAIITKELTVVAGLDAAATEMDALSKQLGAAQVAEYKRSLGLIE